MEVYPYLLEHPIYMPEGHPIVLTLEDACTFSEERDSGEPVIDCGSCRFYRPDSNTLTGVCGHGKNPKA